MRFIFFAVFLGCFFTIYGFSDLSYKVEYVGIEDSTALKTIKSTIQLNTLKKKKPDWNLSATCPTKKKFLSD